MINPEMDDYFGEAYKKALKLLSYGPRSKEALSERLAEAGFPQDAVSAAVAAMEEAGFINDEKMARNYVAYAVESKQYGQYRVVQELVSKGIDRRLAEASYDRYIAERAWENDGGDDNVELENAVNTLRKRIRQSGLEPEDLEPADARRLTGFLHRRGFSFDIIEKAFECLKNIE